MERQEIRVCSQSDEIKTTKIKGSGGKKKKKAEELQNTIPNCSKKFTGTNNNIDLAENLDYNMKAVLQYQLASGDKHMVCCTFISAHSHSTLLACIESESLRSSGFDTFLWIDRRRAKIIEMHV